MLWGSGLVGLTGCRLGLGGLLGLPLGWWLGGWLLGGLWLLHSSMALFLLPSDLAPGTPSTTRDVKGGLVLDAPLHIAANCVALISLGLLVFKMEEGGDPKALHSAWHEPGMGTQVERMRNNMTELHMPLFLKRADLCAKWHAVPRRCTPGYWPL